MTAFTILVVTLALVGYLGFYSDVLDLAWLHHNFLQVLTGSVLFSFALSLYLYVTSFSKGKLLAAGGNTSVGFYNFFIGRELNPRIGCARCCPGGSALLPLPLASPLPCPSPTPLSTCLSSPPPPPPPFSAHLFHAMSSSLSECHPPSLFSSAFRSLTTVS